MPPSEVAQSIGAEAEKEEKSIAKNIHKVNESMKAAIHDGQKAYVAPTPMQKIVDD